MSDTKTKRKTGKRAVIALIVILFILVLLALPWIYLQFAAFPYDDYRTMAAENKEPFDFVDFTPEGELTVRLTKADLYFLGLNGTPNAAARRIELLTALNLPKNLSANAMLDALNSLYAPEEVSAAVKALQEQRGEVSDDHDPQSI